MGLTPEQQLHEMPDSGDGKAMASDTQNTAMGQLDRTPGSIDKIRDILFGANMREYDAHFLRLEAALMKETNDLRENTRRRFEALETYLKKEIETLHARLKSEREERAEALAQRSREVKETAEGLDRKIRDLEDQTAAEDSSIRQEILNHSHVLTEDLRAMQTEITALVEKRFEELRRGKTDRTMLSNLLREIGMRINDEFHIPADK